MALEVISNNGQTTLSGAINNSVTSLVVASAASLPSTGRFRIIIDSEIIIVGTVSGTTLGSLVRGAEGTSAASHSNGAAVRAIISRDGLAALAQASFGGVSVRDYGALGNGSTNDTTAFNNAIATAGASGKVYVPAGTYMVTSLSISHTDFTLELGAGATIRQVASTNGDFITLTGDRSRIVGYGTIDNNGDNNTSGFSTVRVQADDVDLIGFRVIGVANYGIRMEKSRGRILNVYFGNPRAAAPGSAVMVQPIDNSIDRDGPLIEGVTIFVTNSNTWAGIGGRSQDTEGGIRVKGLRVVNCVSVLPMTNTRENIGVAWMETAQYLGNYIRGGGFGISIPDSDGFLVANNFIAAVNDSASGVCSLEAARSNGVIANNVIDQSDMTPGAPRQAAMLLSAGLTAASKGILVIGNVFRKCETGVVTGFNSQSKVAVDNNIFIDCGGTSDSDATFGIKFEASSNGGVDYSTRNNRFYGFTGEACIHVGTGDGTDPVGFVGKGDEFHDVTRGYRIVGANDVRITDATFRGITVAGITIVGTQPADILIERNDPDTWDIGYGPFKNAGAPTNGASGTRFGKALKGALLIDTTNGTLYQNTGTLASPTWTSR